MPEEQRDQFKALMTKYLDLGRVTAAIKAAMIKTFTADELKALADFYGSDVGKSAMAKMGTYMSEVMPATMNEVQSALMKAQGEAHKEQPIKAIRIREAGRIRRWRSGRNASAVQISPKRRPSL